jgi:hypothetical protein
MATSSPQPKRKTKRRQKPRTPAEDAAKYRKKAATNVARAEALVHPAEIDDVVTPPRNPVEAEARVYGLEAVHVLRDIMRMEKAPVTSRLQAARGILETAYGRPAAINIPASANGPSIVVNVLQLSSEQRKPTTIPIEAEVVRDASEG